MLKNRIYLLLFVVILIAGFFLRFYKVSDIPPGVNRDEASIGYTAYSLLQTGKDEYGRKYPLSFQSFGDWKLPLYIYETVLSVKALGLNELAVRAPSALAGIATVGLVFFLTQELFANVFLSFLTMAVLAIAPWHIHMSRVESESNTAVLLVTLAVLLFLKGIKKRYWLLIPSAVLFALSYFTYAGNYIFTTLLVLGMFVIFRKEIPRRRESFIAAAAFLLISLFIGLQTLSANNTKISGIGIFGDPSVIHAQIEIPRNQHSNPKSLLARTVHNKIIYWGQRFFQNYFNSYSAQFLFISGGTNRAHNIENFGNMYLIEAPFLFLGIIFFLTQKKGKSRNLVLWWFFIAPLAASITKDAPHSNRMFAIFPILALVTACGIWWIISFVKKNKLFSYVVYLAIIFIYSINFLIYIDAYYIHFPYNESLYWGYGYKKLESLLETPQFSNKNIIMSAPETSPYIYLAFYSKYDPLVLQKTITHYPVTSDGFLHVKAFGKYVFKEIDYGADIHNKNTILVDFSKNVPEYIKHDYKTTDILLPNGMSMFTIIQAQ